MLGGIKPVGTGSSILIEEKGAIGAMWVGEGTSALITVWQRMSSDGPCTTWVSAWDAVDSMCWGRAMGSTVHVQRRRIPQRLWREPLRQLVGRSSAMFKRARTRSKAQGWVGG